MRAEQEDVYDDHYFTAKGDWVEGVWSLGYVQAEHKVRGGRLQRSSTPCEAWWATSGDRMRRGLRFGRDSQGRGFEVVGIELNATMATHPRTTLGLNMIQGRIEDIESDSFRQNFDVARSVEPV